MYPLLEPPFVLLAFGLLIGMTCGITFEEVLKQGLQKWQQDRTSNILSQLQGLSLLLPFVGICLGMLVFLGSGLAIFGLPIWLALGASFLLTVFTSWLIWVQLKQVLRQIQRGGSRAIDLDLPEETE